MIDILQVITGIVQFLITRSSLCQKTIGLQKVIVVKIYFFVEEEKISQK